METASTTIDGWTFNRVLGSGGFGIVELWENSITSQKLAVKKCKWDDIQLTQTQKDRWTNEVKIMERLNHPNIVKTEIMPFHYPSKEVMLPILCMEYCRKGDLRRVLNKPDNCCGINEHEAIKIMSEILSAVEYLHCYNITHRDLKPENIVLQDINNTVTYKLIDLGYAKELGEASTSASIVGTLNYVAPELLWKEKYSCSVDYWSLGILFYEIVTGVRPFLPRMQHTMTWMQHIKRKAYDEICAYEFEEKVIFGKTIESPTTLSKCVKDKLVAWFRVVLQFDPKKRGRIYDENGKSQLVVFQLLQSILSEKIIYIFYVSLYKIEAYEVNNHTTIGDLQCSIEKHSGISIGQQTLTDYYGSVLTQCNAFLLSQIHDPVIFVFKNGHVLLENVPAIDIPIAVQKMIEKSRNQLDFQTAKDCYRATIFFMQQEIHLFQLYIFAISIKIDLMNMKINTFRNNMQTALLNTTTLVEELHTFHLRFANKGITEKSNKALENTFKRVKNLTTAASRIKLHFTSLTQDYEKLKNLARQNDCLNKLPDPYNKATSIFESLNKQNHHKNVESKDMVKQVFQFIKIREGLLHDNGIKEIGRQIYTLEEDLLKLEESFHSVIVMTHVYQEQLHNIGLEIKQASEQFALRVNANDNVIYDNLILRHTLDNVMAEIMKKYPEMLNLDS